MLEQESRRDSARAQNEGGHTCTRPTPTAPGDDAGHFRDFFAGELITEHGGSFLNSSQTAVRRLAAMLDLRLEVVDGGDLPRGDEVFFIDGRVYTYVDANADWHDPRLCG